MADTYTLVQHYPLETVCDLGSTLSYLPEARDIVLQEAKLQLN